ncbi:IS1 family transposase, partial [Methyloglobulus sp.]|uniref:IS1 family transposase n=1 Tax=Methyloglobulus sp. TaxID=2518622 RepID=UPI0032B80938
EMAINSSGIRDTARVIKINKNTVISTLKKAAALAQVNPLYHKDTAKPREVRLEPARLEAELDEQWSFVGDKSQTNAGCGTPLTRPPTPCAGLCVRQAQGHGVPRLESVACAVQHQPLYTDDRWAYECHLDAGGREVGKRNTQKIERKNLTTGPGSNGRPTGASASQRWRKCMILLLGC